MINKAILVGRVVADPEVRYTAGGEMVVNMRLATDEQWRDKDGEKVQKAEYHRIIAFGAQAEIAGKYLAKGRLVFIEGRIQTRKWTDKEGVDRYTTEIVAFIVKMLDSAKTNSASQDLAPGADDVFSNYDQGISF